MQNLLLLYLAVWFTAFPIVARMYSLYFETRRRSIDDDSDEYGALRDVCSAASPGKELVFGFSCRVSVVSSRSLCVGIADDTRHSD